MAPTWAPINYPPNTTLLADARAVYCVDPDQTDPRQHRHVTASRIPLWNNWRKAMGKYRELVCILELMRSWKCTGMVFPSRQARRGYLVIGYYY